tara:strand:+ start:242 stop:610 length:369 start_codon:yes stop_codon:yes gene_type:complete
MNDELIIYGIFNADSSFMSEIRYSVRKVLGRSDCNLCEITYGWNPFGKKDWKDAISASPIRIELIHRDEGRLSQLNAASGLPTFIISAGDGWVELMNADTIATFKDRPADLIDALNQLIPTI